MHFFFFWRNENLCVHSCKAEHSKDVSVYRRAAYKPNQVSSMQQVVQSASNGGSPRQNNDSTRKNITATADAIPGVINVTI